MAELRAYIRNNRYDIIAITEVFPKNCGTLDYDSPLWSIEGYVCHKPKNKAFTGRGCLIYTKDDLPFYDIMNLDTKFVEYVQTGISINQNSKLLLSCIYRSPNATDPIVLEEIKHLLTTKKIQNVNFDFMIHMGDFNFKDIDWELQVSTSNLNQLSVKFLQIIEDSYLIQHIIEPTRLRDGNAPSTLDLIFTNEVELVEDITHNAPLGKSDHETIEFELITVGNLQTKEIKPKLNYNKGDYVTIREKLDLVNWEVELNYENVEEVWLKFAELLNKITRENIPVCNFKPKLFNTPWMKADVLEAVKTKRSKWKKYKYCKNDLNREIYNHAKNIASTKVKEAKNNYEKKLVEGMKSNPKKF